jgi:hypothetical protein
MTQPGRPAVFVHGLWLHASSWSLWLELFQEAGYTPTAPGWPGDLDTVEASRRDPSQVAGKGIDDVIDHYARIIRGLEALRSSSATPSAASSRSGCSGRTWPLPP